MNINMMWCLKVYIYADKNERGILNSCLFSIRVTDEDKNDTRDNRIY